MTRSSERKPMLLSMGDPAGIGPEITLKAWSELKDTIDLAFAVVAPLAVIEKVNEKANIPLQIVSSVSEVEKVFPTALPIINIQGEAALSGIPSSRHAASITKSIEWSVERCLAEDADAIITNPIAKDVLYEAGFSFPGHTEYLGELTKHQDALYERGPVMMLSGGGLRVGLATVHLPLHKAVKQLDAEKIIRNAKVIHGALKHDFGILEPRISLTGLNPHAGENGALGHEEDEIINPAAQYLREEGINVTDAQPADTLFHAEAREHYDAVLAMYHDQGLIPVKTLDFHGGVNITLGLPIIRTSPDHGTAFDIAGQGIARTDSLIAAIKMAREIANNRKAYLNG